MKNGVFWVVTTRRNNPEDTILHSHRRENLKSYRVDHVRISQEMYYVSDTSPKI
jgi:hypothetical protein